MREAPNARSETPTLIIPRLRGTIRAGASPPPEKDGDGVFKAPVHNV